MADEPIYSPTEMRIQKVLAQNPQLPFLRIMAADLDRIVNIWQSRGINLEMQAAAATVHLVSMLTALKISALLPADFIDLLADDLVDTIKGRAHPGVPKWLTPQ